MSDETTPSSQPKRPKTSRLKWAIRLLVVILAAPAIAYVTFRWMARGDDPFDVDAFTAYTLPDEQNAFAHYRKAGELYVGDSESTIQVILMPHVGPPSARQNREKFWESVEAAEKGDWQQTNPDVRRWLTLNRPALDEFERGAACTESLEIPAAEASSQPAPPFALEPIRSCGRLVALDACRLTAEGQPVEAWNRYRSLLRASRHLAMHCTTMGLLIGSAMIGVGFDGAIHWSGEKSVGAKELKQAIRDVLAVEEMQTRVSDPLKLEYLLLRDLADKDISQGTQLPRWVQLTGYPAHLKQTGRQVIANLLTQVDRSRWLRTAVHPGKFGLFELDAASAKDPKYLPPEEIERYAVSSAEDVADTLHWVVPLALQIRIYDPQSAMRILHLMYESADRAQVRRSALLLALALQLHYREHGEFPASLNELVKKGYLKSIPVDTFGKGEPLRYRREPAPERGATLWSVWVDGIDQNGTEAERLMEDPGDWVVHVWVPGTSESNNKVHATGTR